MAPAAAERVHCSVGSSNNSNRMGGGGGSPAASGGSSSSEDDGDAAWKAAIDSIASVGFSFPSSNGVAKAASSGSREVNNRADLEEPREGKPKGPGLKLYQVKVTLFAHSPSFFVSQIHHVRILVPGGLLAREFCIPFARWRN